MVRVGGSKQQHTVVWIFDCQYAELFEKDVEVIGGILERKKYKKSNVRERTEIKWKRIVWLRVSERLTSAMLLLDVSGTEMTFYQITVERFSIFPLVRLTLRGVLWNGTEKRGRRKPGNVTVSTDFCYGLLKRTSWFEKDFEWFDFW